MIQIYKPGTSLEKNGDIVLMPKECTVTARLNEVWVLEMVHPIDPDGRWAYIVEEGILKVPTWQTDEQLYRISQVEKTETEVRVTAYPIFTDTRNQCFIEDLTVSGTGQTVLNQMLALGPDNNSGGKLYSATSNLPTARRARFTRRNFMDCLNGTDDPTFIDLWGGEIAYDNFRIYVNQEIGADHDVYVRYGKNILGVEYTVDFSEVCTRIYPEAYGGYGIQSGQAWVDSSLINQYDCLYVRNVVFDNIRLLEDVPNTEDSVNYIVCANRSQMDTYLRQACRDMFADGCDKPKVSMKVDLIDLSTTDQYKDFADLETISLGDTVHCVHSKLGVTSDSRAVCIVWDCARDRIQSVELGEFTYDYFRDVSTKVNAISRITNPDGSIMAERVRGFLDATKTSIHTIRTTATDAHVMGVLFEDKVQGSNTYGALGIGTKGLMIAKEWDENTNDWAWETAVTANGILSPMIVTQAISGETATNWWDLQLGEISFQTISDDINNRIQIAADGIDTDMTGLEICNAIFDGGSIKGFMTRTVDGRKEFYLSFSALIGGELSLGGPENGNGAMYVYDAENNTIMKADKDGFELRHRYQDQNYGSFGYRYCNTVWEDGGLKTYGYYRSQNPTPETFVRLTRANFDQNGDGKVGFDDQASLLFEVLRSNGTMGFKADDIFLMDQSGNQLADFDDDSATIFKDLHLPNVSFSDGSPSILYPMLGMDGGVVREFYINGSSKRYKNVGRETTKNDIAEAYKIKVYQASYKDGYLVKGDQREGLVFPMFVAEQMYEHLPIAVDLNKKGTPENWNHRIIIPIMFQMITDQKKTIDEQTEKIEDLEARLSKLEAILKA